MFKLQVEKRDARGKALVHLRGKGKIPAVFYGPKEHSVPITLSLREFSKVWSAAGESSVIELSGIGEAKEALIHEVTVDAVSGKPQHADFYILEKGKKIEKGTDGNNYSALQAQGNSYIIDQGLNTGTNYYYRLDEGIPVVRKPLVGDDSTLAITDADVIRESVLVSKDKVQLTLSWKTNRGATSLVDFDTSPDYGQKTKEDISLNMGHSVTLDSLNPDTTYHFKVTSTDIKNNTVSSTDFTFRTPVIEKEKSPLDIIVETLQRVFDVFRNVF